MNDQDYTDPAAEMAVAKIAPQPELPVAVQEVAPEPKVTPQQARTEAVADALHAAYAKASTLVITPEEAKALAEDFPNEAFRRGAGGDDRLIYIEHAYLRQRLNQVLGVGAATPIRRREWAEEFTYTDKWNKTAKAVRVYADLVLLVLGAVVGEAIGDSVYYPSNAKSNYSDALESAKSNAFRRCCKEFGVGLQAWMKGWCEQWEKWERSGKAAPSRPAPAPAPAATPAAPGPEPAATEAQPAAEEAIAALRKLIPSGMEPEVVAYLRSFKTGSGKVTSWLGKEDTLDVLRADRAEYITKNWATFMAQVEAAMTGDIADLHEPKGEVVEGEVEHVSEKSGEKGGKKWTRFGIKLGGEWYNTFDTKLADLAKGLKGKQARIEFRKTEFGADLLSITPF